MRNDRHVALRKRHQRVRRKVIGAPTRPRLCVRKSLCHIYAQIVDDLSGRTLLAATTNTKESKAAGRKTQCNKAGAKRLGESLGRLAIEKGVAQVVFDRGGYKYHGVVRELAEAVRAAGVKF